MRSCFPISVLLASLLSGAQAADIATSGDWTRSINATDLARGAGSDLNSQYESPAGVTIASISNTAGGAWRVTAHRSNGLWDSSVSLLIKRTSSGSGSGVVIGGDAYIELTSIDTQVFSGTGDQSNIGLQFKLVGLSKTVAPNAYNASITFTVE